jgi:hypothetical protein
MIYEVFIGRILQFQSAAACVMLPSWFKLTKMYLAIAETHSILSEPRNMLLTRNIRLRGPFLSPYLPRLRKLKLFFPSE